MTDEILTLDLTLAVSARDLQFLVGLHALYSTVVSDDATEEQVMQNMISQAALCVLHYSAFEANALVDRMQALLPPDSPLVIVREGGMQPSRSTHIS